MAELVPMNIGMEIVAAVSAAGTAARVMVSTCHNRVVDRLSAGAREGLIASGILQAEDIPKGPFFWLSGLQRYGAEPTPAETRQAARIIWSLWLALANGAPVLTQCRRSLARQIMRSLPRWFGATVQVLRGSLRKANPYPPLLYRMPDGSDGSDGADDHILMVAMSHDI